jgi:hypothetical protein
MKIINQTILVIEDSLTDDEALKLILGKDHCLIYSTSRKDVLESDGYKDIDLFNTLKVRLKTRFCFLQRDKKLSAIFFNSFIY